MLYGLYLQLKNLNVGDVSRGAPVAEHRVLFFGLVFFTALELSVFIGLKIGGAVDYGAGVKRLGEGVDALIELFDKIFASILFNHVLGVLADLGNHELGSQQAHAVNITAGDIFGQLGLSQIYIDPGLGLDGLSEDIGDGGGFYSSGNLAVVDFAV
ncbi:hypothetical protein ES703_113526 [subsurface metagenome]